MTFQSDEEIGVNVGFYLISNVHGKSNMQKLDPDDIAKLTSIPSFDVATKVEPTEKMDVDIAQPEKVCSGIIFLSIKKFSIVNGSADISAFKLP